MGSQFNPNTTQENGILDEYIQESSTITLREDRPLLASIATIVDEISYQPNFFRPFKFDSLVGFNFDWDIFRANLDANTTGRFEYSRIELYQSQ